MAEPSPPRGGNDKPGRRSRSGPQIALRAGIPKNLTDLLLHVDSRDHRHKPRQNATRPAPQNGAGAESLMYGVVWGGLLRAGSKSTRTPPLQDSPEDTPRQVRRAAARKSTWCRLLKARRTKTI